MPNTPTCKCGVELEPRPLSLQTPEQRFCGDWYDHPPRQFGLTGHVAALLVQSEALTAQHEAMQ